MLSHRLKTLAGYYLPFSHVYDIGCDHGLLGLSFVDNPEVKQINLVDPAIDVIHTLTNKVNDSYITKKDLIRILHQKGQEVTLGPERKTIFLAGMGGKEIQDILKALENQLNASDRVVISPHRNILELRQYLGLSSFGLVEEISIKDEEQFYQILVLELSDDLPKVNPFGIQTWQGSVGKEHLERQLKHFALHQDPLSKSFVAYLRALNN